MSRASWRDSKKGAILHLRPLGSRGFTIVELLVSTVVFGVVMLIITIAILQFTRVYYKGVTESKTQAVARTIVDRIAQSIQFNGGVVTTTGARSPGTVMTFCVGNQQFTYKVGRQLVESTPNGDQTYHALVVKDLANCNASSGGAEMDTLATSGKELLAPKMRLANMEITNPGGGKVFKVSVRVIYGDADLIQNPTAANATCQNIRSGTEFCAVSEINTTIVKRVE